MLLFQTLLFPSLRLVRVSWLARLGVKAMLIGIGYWQDRMDWRQTKMQVSSSEVGGDQRTGLKRSLVRA